MKYPRNHKIVLKGKNIKTVLPGWGPYRMFERDSHDKMNRLKKGNNRWHHEHPVYYKGMLDHRAKK